MRFKSVSNKVIVENFKLLMETERLTTAEIVEYVREMDRRKLFLDHGHTSLFAFLTKGLGYAPASAQRRIESARLLDCVPELKQDLESGSLNLTQVSIVAHSIRQKLKEEPGVRFTNEDKQDLLNKVKNQDTRETEKILAQELKLEIKVHEKQKIQSDESVRLEITLSKDEMETIDRVKDLISHMHPNPTWAEIINYLAREFVKRKDPLKKKTTSAAEVMTRQKSGVGEATPADQSRFISAEKRRAISHRDKSCRWKCGTEVCGSTFQLQIDHIQPVWAGGGNEVENLQALCSIHNQLKYKNESRIKEAFP